MDGISGGKRKTVGHASSVDHSRVQKSTTLSRRFVKRPKSNLMLAGSASAASVLLRKQLQEQEQRQRIKSVVVAQAQQLSIQSKQQKRVLIQRKNSVKLSPVQQKQQQQQQQKQAQNQQAVVVKKEKKQVFARRKVIDDSKDERIAPAQPHRVAVATRERIARQKQVAQPGHLSAQELKERAIQQALRRVDEVKPDKTMLKQMAQEEKSKGRFWQRSGFVAAAAMAVVLIALLGYLVHLNLPDISVRVTAMQTGIDKIYPSYVPVSYRLDGLVKEDAGRVTMNFRNDEGKTFTLFEEKTSWDSAAVLANYVKKNWGSDYSIAKGQGLTIYISGSNAAWVNGGVLYTITDDSGSLSALDLHDIAVSL